MLPDRLMTVAAALACLLGLGGCWIFPEDDAAECPVASRDSDALRMPPYVPAMPGDDFGESSASGMAAITLRAPRGHYSLSVRPGFEVDRICRSDSTSTACTTQFQKLDFDFVAALADSGDPGELGDFAVECKGQGDACDYLRLDCDLDLCDATLSVPLHVEISGPLAEPIAVIVEASLTGDVCGERLPVATVQLSGWEEPPVRAPAD